ncbi:MAG: hypothetical protein M1820_003446 [Bogoriella megaspora]|nr:MAG: hypothetical protein M1820_003446 [Bogoriella megaspora]
MPQLKQLNCQIELSGSDLPLREYHTRYGDGFVDTFVAIPAENAKFNIHLTSHGYIAPGLGIYVFIDGVYQCNRFRNDLVIPDGHSPAYATEVDFRVRQKEEPRGGGSFTGREWTFEKLNTVSADKASKLDSDVSGNIGSIEIVVLRCKGPEIEEVPDEDSRSSPSTPRQPKSSEKQKAGSKKGSKAGSEPEGSVGGLFGLFDGAMDDGRNQYSMNPVPFSSNPGRRRRRSHTESREPPMSQSDRQRQTQSRGDDRSNSNPRNEVRFRVAFQDPLISSPFSAPPAPPPTNIPSASPTARSQDFEGQLGSSTLSYLADNGSQPLVPVDRSHGVASNRYDAHNELAQPGNNRADPRLSFSGTGSMPRGEFSRLLDQLRTETHHTYDPSHAAAEPWYRRANQSEYDRGSQSIPERHSSRASHPLREQEPQPYGIGAAAQPWHGNSNQDIYNNRLETMPKDNRPHATSEWFSAPVSSVRHQGYGAGYGGVLPNDQQQTSEHRRASRNALFSSETSGDDYGTCQSYNPPSRLERFVSEQQDLLREQNRHGSHHGNEPTRSLTKHESHKLHKSHRSRKSGQKHSKHHHKKDRHRSRRSKAKYNESDSDWTTSSSSSSSDTEVPQGRRNRRDKHKKSSHRSSEEKQENRSSHDHAGNSHKSASNSKQSGSNVNTRANDNGFASQGQGGFDSGFGSGFNNPNQQSWVGNAGNNQVGSGWGSNSNHNSGVGDWDNKNNQSSGRGVWSSGQNQGGGNPWGNDQIQHGGGGHWGGNTQDQGQYVNEWTNTGGQGSDSNNDWNNQNKGDGDHRSRASSHYSQSNRSQSNGSRSYHSQSNRSQKSAEGGSQWEAGGSQTSGAGGWGGSDKAPSSKSKSRRPSKALSTGPPKREIKSYWSSPWKSQGVNQPSGGLDPESQRHYREQQLYPIPEEPLYPILEETVKGKGVEHQVKMGRGADYSHRIGKPDYLDTMEDPYAVFQFKYRSQKALEKILGYKLPREEPCDTRKRMMGMSKEELVEELMKTKISGGSSKGEAKTDNAGQW